jgi:hypothetical protein
VDLQTLGKLVVIGGISLLVAGGLLWLLGGLGIRSLPGDLHFGGQGWGCFLPITTSILLSIILTLLLNLILRFMGR